MASQLTSAAGLQDALVPAGPQAAHIHDLWWLVIAVCGVVFVLVFGAFLIALWRAPRARDTTPPDVAAIRSPERAVLIAVSAALGVAAVGLAGLIVASVLTDRALAALPLDGGIVVEVTAKQWWWDVRYDDHEPSRVFRTANELHVPAGRPVLVKLQSDDVIHSFWVPSLHGKKDLIPGHTSLIRIRADTPGVYRGQCAEFCGLQHAKMAFHVIALEPAAFDAWAAQQRAAAREPSNDAQARGREVFMSSTCVGCHTIQGTAAHARVGPDLTHLASRRALAAGTVPNTRGYLAGWIADPQSIKPGALMPATPLDAADLQALVAYLESLE